MKPLLATLLLCGLLGAQPLTASTPPDLPTERPPAPQETPASPEEAAMEKLFSTMGTDNFAQALGEAQKASIHPQVLIETRFLHLIDKRDTPGLAAMAPELLEKRDTFDPGNSQVFSLKEDWLAIVEYTQALAALEKGDKAGFKKHITEAFWLSPRQGQAFAPHIDKFRLEDAMKSVTLNPARVMQPQQSDGKPTTLGELTAGHKATVLHFWSPMSQEVQTSLPDFVLTTQSCADQNIAVLSILVGQYPGILKDAETLRKDDASKAKCVWLLDSNKNSLASLLRVTDIPTVAIVSPGGKILFNGHPSDAKFWQTLQQVSPGFKRPDTPAENTTPAPGKPDHNHTGS